jgi:hypothetical protein
MVARSVFAIGSNRRSQDPERATSEAAAKAKRAEAERIARNDAQKIVAHFETHAMRTGAEPRSPQSSSPG